MSFECLDETAIVRRVDVKPASSRHDKLAAIGMEGHVGNSEHEKNSSLCESVEQDRSLSGVRHDDVILRYFQALAISELLAPNDVGAHL